MKSTARKSTSPWNDIGMNTRTDGTNPLVCRTCLSGDSEKLHHLFAVWTHPWSWSVRKGEPIAVTITSITATEITKSDGYPQYICQSCFTRLKVALSFCHQVRSNDRRMRSERLFRMPATSLSEDHSDPGEQLVTDVKQEAVSDEEISDMDYADVMDCADIKIEPEEFVKQSVGNRVNGHKSPRSNIVISSSFSVEPETFSPQAAVNGTIRDSVSSSENELLVKEELETEVDSDIDLECMLCDRQFQTLIALKTHVVRSHAYETVTRGGDRPGASRARHRCAQSLATLDDSEATTRDCNKCASSTETVSSSDGVEASRVTSQQRTRTVRELRSSYNSALDGSMKKDTQEDKYKCTMCKEDFDDILHLKIHNAVHHYISNADSEPNNVKAFDNKEINDEKFHTGEVEDRKTDALNDIVDKNIHEVSESRKKEKYEIKVSGVETDGSIVKITSLTVEETRLLSDEETRRILSGETDIFQPNKFKVEIKMEQQDDDMLGNLDVVQNEIGEDFPTVKESNGNQIGDKGKNGSLDNSKMLDLFVSEACDDGI